MKARQILLELLNDNQEAVENFLQTKDADFAYLHTD
jgi:hypothetical protein